MDIVRQILAVVMVFAALGGALWVLRRSGSARWTGLGRKRTGYLEPIERVALSPHHSLHLVRFGDRALLISAHPGGCTLLDGAPWRDCSQGLSPEGPA